MNAPVVAYLALGSNQQDPRAQLSNAIEAIKKLPRTEWLQGSSWYQTAPVGRLDQPDFLNAVCAIRTELAPEALLDELFNIEQRQGRVRGNEKGGPRNVDLDLLLYGDLRVSSERLTLPHPRMHERAFVLVPLFEIAPDLLIPGVGEVASLKQAVGPQRIQRVQS
jgi:2-amino-4-hydroxy-6-hydroxymethyldihydropteridine diphosphokinase